MNTSVPSPTPTAQALVGWVLESPGRGTLSIILSCLTTIFLCTWVVIYSRVTTRRLHTSLHKTVLFLKAVIAPEFIAVEGLQEWSQANKMVKSCSSLTEGRLKMVHAFYIGMLGLRYRTINGSRVIWPNQYTWLLEERLIDWKDHGAWGLSEEYIEDKSNADGAAKLLALIQVSWFVAQSIMRRAYNLPLAQLEVMTLGYIPLVAVTYYFWWVKPKDITTPSIVDLPAMSPMQKKMFEAMAVSNAFDCEGNGRQDSVSLVFSLTPRVFEKEATDKALLEAQQKAWQDAQLKARKDAQRTGQPFVIEAEPLLVRRPEIPIALPKETVVAYWDPDIYHSWFLWPASCLFGASFGAIHLMSWNSVFPTTIEMWLWRVGALTSTFSMLSFMQFRKTVMRWGGPLTLISIASPALYLLSRLLMIGLVIASFRAEDPAVYNTCSLSTYWM